MEVEPHQVAHTTSAVHKRGEHGTGPDIFPQFHFPEQAAHLASL
jgi:hypothetical protein